MFHQHHQKRRANPLDSRIRQMVRSIKQSQRHINEMPSFAYLCDNSQFLPVRCFWFLITLTCMVLCCYQTTQRILFYRSTPIAVDVEMAEASQLVFPAVSICSVMTEEISELLKTKTSDEGCETALAFLVSGIFPGYNVTTLWKMADISKPTKATVMHKTESIATLDRKNTEMSPYGTCGTFSSGTPFTYRAADQKLVLQIHNHDPGCVANTIHGSTHGVGEPFNIRNMWAVGYGSENSFSYAVTQYKFLSNPGRRCSSEAKFDKCIARCKTKFYEKMPCKFPFFPSDVDLPWCPPSNETAQFFLDAKSMFLRFNHVGICNCDRPCAITQMEQLRVQLDGQSKTNSTIISMHFSTNLVRVVTERYAYDLVSLLCDVGGNTGLYLGLSLLSVFELVFNIAQYVFSNQRKTKVFLADPLFKKVCLIYYDHIKRVKVADPVPRSQTWKPAENYNRSNRQPDERGVKQWNLDRRQQPKEFDYNTNFNQRYLKRFSNQMRMNPRPDYNRFVVGHQTHRRNANYDWDVNNQARKFYPGGTKYLDLSYNSDVALQYSQNRPQKYLQKRVGGTKRRALKEKTQRQRQSNTVNVKPSYQEEVESPPRKLNCTRIFKLIRFITIIVFVIICIGLIAGRIAHYNSRPTYMTIDVDENETVTFPSLTICTPSNKLTEKRIEKAKKIGKLDYCEVEFLDMIDEDMDASQLWNLSDNKNDFYELFSTLKKNQPRNIQTTFPLPTSTCQRFDVEPVNYAGWNSFFCVFFGYRGVCDEKYYTLYFTPPGEEVNYASYIHVPIDSSLEVSFTGKKQTYDPTATPCANSIEAADCKRICLQEKLTKITCRLPYMDYLDNITFCSTPAAAKKAHSTYMEAFLTTDVIKDCGCNRRCEITIYNARIFIFQQNLPLSFTTFTFQHPYIEIFRQIPAYHWEKLFCDIGAVLGLMLGISVYSLSELVQNVGMHVYVWCRRCQSK